MLLMLLLLSSLSLFLLSFRFPCLCLLIKVPLREIPGVEARFAKEYFVKYQNRQVTEEEKAIFILKADGPFSHTNSETIGGYKQTRMALKGKRKEKLIKEGKTKEIENKKERKLVSQKPDVIFGKAWRERRQAVREFSFHNFVCCASCSSSFSLSIY